jgi:hypothetical protein
MRAQVAATMGKDDYPMRGAFYIMSPSRRFPACIANVVNHSDRSRGAETRARERSTDALPLVRKCAPRLSLTATPVSHPLNPVLAVQSEAQDSRPIAFLPVRVPLFSYTSVPPRIIEGRTNICLSLLAS